MTAPSRPVLLVGEDAAVREMIAHILETRGHAVALATDPDDVLARCREEHPAVIVVEAVLPSERWAVAIKDLQAELGAACPPIVMLTGSWFEDEPEDLTGRVEALVVPQRGDALIALVERYVAPLRRG